MARRARGDLTEGTLILPRLIAHHVRHLAEALVGQGAERLRHPLFVERQAHRASRRQARLDRQPPARGACAASVTVGGNVVRWAAQPADVEQREAVLARALDAALDVAGVKARERRLVAGHERIEVIDDAVVEKSDMRFASQHIPRSLAGRLDEDC
jgi:hypothetical protein